MKKTSKLQTQAKKSAIPKGTASKESSRVARIMSDQKYLKERLHFEMLLCDISTSFINLPADKVDSEIGSAMRDVCNFLKLDLSALWQCSQEDSSFLTMTHLYRPLGGPPVPKEMNATEYFPWSLQQVMAKKIVACSSIEKLPPEAVRDKEVWRHYGVKTTLTFPLSVGTETPFGAVSFNTMKSERSWPEPIVKRLQLVAQVFANAIARQKADSILRESKTQLRLAAEAASVGLWSLDLNTGCYWLTEKSRELFDFDADELVTYDRVIESIHPEDRELVHQARSEVVNSKKEGSVEYRIIRSDGSIRWIVSRGRVLGNASGNYDRLMGVSLDITERKQMEFQLKDQLREIENFRQSLERENIYLKEECKLHFFKDEIIGKSEALKRVLLKAEKVAQTESTVLIMGETGTGKELIAHAIHNASRRRNRLLVKVDCASLPSALIESELFGREKGAYTGALTSQTGRFQLADGSTIFLDEIGELPIELQSKLLRVLENGEYERLGSPNTCKVDVRVIAATNRNLEEAVKKGTFREDLFYRLKVFPIVVPPLRERVEDIPIMVHSFAREFSGRMAKNITTIPKTSIEILQRYSWPGNVRELRNIIEQAVIISDGDALDVKFPEKPLKQSPEVGTLEIAERQHIMRALKQTSWRIKGKNGAAALLGLKPSTLYTKMDKLRIPTNRQKTV